MVIRRIWIVNSNPVGIAKNRCQSLSSDHLLTAHHSYCSFLPLPLNTRSFIPHISYLVSYISSFLSPHFYKYFNFTADNKQRRTLARAP